MVGDSASSMERETTLLGLSPKWAASLQLFSIRREKPSAERGLCCLAGSGWTRTLNTPDSLQASGPHAFSSHHRPETTREAKFTSPGHFREHRNASWQLPPSLLSVPRNQVHRGPSPQGPHRPSHWSLQLSSLTNKA